jgi:hypothetical protein
VETQTYTITFKNASGEIAARYATELKNALLDATSDLKVDLRRANAHTQDFGSTLVLVLGTPAVLAVATAIGDWLKLRHSVIIDIEKDGHVHAENITSKDALRLAELFQFKGE